MLDENELYDEWRSAPEEKRCEVEEKLLQKVLSHARAVVWETLHEWNPDIVQDVAIAVWRGLSRFRRESKFSTWVHSIAKYKAYEEIRNRVRRRRVFDERKVVVANPGDDKENDRAVYPTTLPNLEGPSSAAMSILLICIIACMARCGPLRVRVADQSCSRVGDDLPGQAELVLEPAAWPVRRRR